MAEIFNWDAVAGNNNSAPPNGAPENMEYDEVNNTMREMYAVIARFIQGSLGGTKTTAGTQPDYTLVSGFTLGAYAAGQVFAFVAHASSTGAVTLNVDGLGAGAVTDSKGNQLGSGDVVANGIYIVARTASGFRVVGNLSTTSIQQLAVNTLAQAYLAGGTANAITVTTGLFTAYANGQLIAFRAANNNSGACTINIDGLGLQSLVDFGGQALASGDIITDRIYLCGRTTGSFRVLTSLPIDLATQVSGILPVANGGSGRASTTAYAVICGGTTGTGAEQSIASVGTSGQVLTSNGAGALPTMQTYANVDFQSFDASGTWTKPTGYGANSAVRIQAWGAGASGGRAGAGDGGGGGGGGACIERWMVLSELGATETVTIGAGGIAQTVDNSNGAAGGNTTFGALVTAYGGGGGGGNLAGGGGGGGGGGTLSAGGTSTSGSGGDGGDGFFGEDDNGGGSGGNQDGGDSIYGGGGGSSGMNATPGLRGGDTVWGGGGGSGGSESGVSPGTGGNSVHGGGGGGGASDTGTPGGGGTSLFGGSGGAGATAAANATAGTAPGGGGGGSETGNSGAGAAGRVRVWVFKSAT